MWVRKTSNPEWRGFHFILPGQIVICRSTFIGSSINRYVLSDLLLVPVGKLDNGFRYEAVFNYFKEMAVD